MLSKEYLFFGSAGLPVVPLAGRFDSHLEYISPNALSFGDFFLIIYVFRLRHSKSEQKLYLCGGLL